MRSPSYFSDPPQSKTQSNGFSPQTQKQARIKALEPYFSNGQLLFITTWNRDYPLAPYRVEQLVHFPLAAHDDGPDALVGTVQLITQGQNSTKVLVPRGR
jgi:predicted phage terminase large subunit-like protein